MPIYFYTTTDKFGFLSNFSRHGFELDGHYWPTVEHYFQAQKFPQTALFGRILKSASPKEAKELGRTRTIPLRSDWESVKDSIMKRAIRRKFETHRELRERLLATGNEPLIENAPHDYYWGIGVDGSGLNMTGKLLMEIRAEFQPKH